MESGLLSTWALCSFERRDLTPVDTSWSAFITITHILVYNVYHVTSAHSTQDTSKAYSSVHIWLSIYTVTQNSSAAIVVDHASC